MSEQVGKHKGAVETLLHEKKELSRLLQIVNSQLQRHLSALEEAGVDTDEFIQEVKQGGEQQSKETGSRQQTENRQAGPEQSEDADTDELLEGENSIDDRDFNPNR